MIRQSAGLKQIDYRQITLSFTDKAREELSKSAMRSQIGAYQQQQYQSQSMVSSQVQSVVPVKQSQMEVIVEEKDQTVEQTVDWGR